MLDSLITSKTRLRLLVKFFVNSNNQSHLRGLADEFGESTNSIRKELNHLTGAGILVRQNDKNKVTYQANIAHPFFHSIQDIIRKYLGLDDLLEQILSRMGDVDQVVLTGDIAEGKDTGQIDVCVCGDQLNDRYIKYLSTRLQKMIDRKVKFELVNKRVKDRGLVLFEK
ncbi:ArsR family transcriptional regulator [Algoriphagus sp. C2-7]|uniref:ArsR family transcriptional regulator n=1 Tax=Algoriphagus sediminis TaxID=3057113 RepID=A0ABT7YEK5_9BACT|nr:ArsR family transcriptional regulator [Algoriphagus sediminis]MDN3204765.1 ArsR family transcriptional regulator [Algoriphagus sediminis]